MKDSADGDEFNAQGLGNMDSLHIFYLPNSPVLPKQELSSSALIELNGNHWRKILTIVAKLMCADKDWRTYRDKQLLDEVGFFFGDYLVKKKSRQHYICGKSHWLTLQKEPITDQDVSCDDANKAWLLKDSKDIASRIMLLPYPDYRQFNNRLIDLIKKEYIN